MKHALMSTRLSFSLRRCRMTSSEIEIYLRTDNFITKSHMISSPLNFRVEFGSAQDISRTTLFTQTSKAKAGKDHHKYLT